MVCLKNGCTFGFVVEVISGWVKSVGLWEIVGDLWIGLEGDVCWWKWDGTLIKEVGDRYKLVCIGLWSVSMF